MADWYGAQVLDKDNDGEVSLEEFMVLVNPGGVVKPTVQVVSAANAFAAAGAGASPSAEGGEESAASADQEPSSVLSQALASRPFPQPLRFAAPAC